MKRKRESWEKKWISAIHHTVSYAKKKKLILPKPCFMCGRDDKVHGHHISYLLDDVFDVVWLCNSHHMGFHTVSKPLFPTKKQIDELGDFCFLTLLTPLEKVMENDLAEILKHSSSIDEAANLSGYRWGDVFRVANKLNLEMPWY